MATNTGKGYRIGSVRDRSQFQHPNGHWIERDTTNGQFKNVKADGDRFKGVAREPDRR